MEKTVSEAIAYRRSVRVYEETPLDTDQVRQCVVNASLAPTSSNMQLWEFYHVTDAAKLKAITTACFDQNAAKTAQQMVVFVTRKDLWRQRAKSNLNFVNSVYQKPDLTEKEAKRKKMALHYYGKLIPVLYSDFLGLFGYLKFFIFWLIGFFKPSYRESRAEDIRVVAHKSTGLAAQNFMISMAAIGYDTCPMEGFDSQRIKKILNLPYGAEINMIVSCGIRSDKGVYGERFRVPFEEVYFQV